MIGSEVTRGRVSSKVCIELYCGDSDGIDTVDSSTSGEGILYPACFHLCNFGTTRVSRDICSLVLSMCTGDKVAGKGPARVTPPGQAAREIRHQRNKNV